VLHFLKPPDRVVSCEEDWLTMIKDGQRKFTLFRGDVLARRVIYSAMSIVGGYMLLATVGNAYVYQRRESHEVRHTQETTPKRAVIVGKASWYGKAAAGRKTSTGEMLDPNKLTAASTELPLQSRALVTNLENGHSVCVRINDCGPYIKGRKIDVSKRAAEKLDIADSGTALVKIELVATPPDSVHCPRSKPVRWRSHDHFHRRSGT
jgi:rare lipoprotein A (peptidoglycan hydrolase)